MNTESQNLITNPGFEAGRSNWIFNSRPSGASFEVMEDKDAPEGERVARVEVGESCRVASLASRWTELNADEAYTLSVFLRSEKGAVPVMLSVWSWADANGGWNKKTQFREAVEVTEQWQRFSLTGTLAHARAGKYQVLLEVEQPAVIYADAIMLEPGSDMTDFCAHADIDFGLDFADPTMLFEYGKPVDVSVCVYNRMEQARPLTLEYVVEDFYGKSVIISRDEVEALPGMTEGTVSLPLEKKGYYKLQVSVIDPDGTTVAKQIASFAVIEKNESGEVEENSPFGVSISPNRLELELRRAKDIGVGHIRVHENFTWRNSEPQEGVYQWDVLEEDAAGDSSALYKPAVYDYSVYRQYGLDPLIYVAGYDKDRPVWADAYGLETQLGLYGDFYEALTSHYEGVFKDFEVVNEPWGHMDAGEYLEILKAVYAKSKKGNPDARIVGATAYHGPQINFLKELIDQGGLDYMDVLSLHPYPRPEAPEAVLIGFIQQVRQWVEAAGRTLPLWITEIGWTTDGLEPLPTRIPRPGHRNNSDTDQAKYLVRSMIVSIANGVEKVDWFHFSGDHTFRYAYHMFEADSYSSPMKTVPVYSAMSRMLGDARMVRKLLEGEGSMYAYLFRDGDKWIIPAWTACKYSTLVLKTGAGSIDAYDIMGNKMSTRQTDGETFEIEVTGTVVYLVADAEVFDQAEALIPLTVNIEPGDSENTYSLQVSLTNVWDRPLKGYLELILPQGVTSTGSARQPLTVEVSSTCEMRIPLTVESTADSLTEYVTVAVQAGPSSEAYVFEAREQLRHINPLPKPEAGIWIEAEEPTEINFEPSPAWLPNQFRSYGGDNLRFRSMRDVSDEDGNIVEYDFTVETAGDYKVMIAASAFAQGEEARGLPTLSWKIDDNSWIGSEESSEVGKPWIYSTHKSIWWRFKNHWHDMGNAYLVPGKHRLFLKLGTPAKSDYSYLTIDAITILNHQQEQAFMERLNQ
ncbi:MAG: hypothetical protein Q7Q73_10225 [Verrucomicrobiota bacterium JB024]|nr:hypothetical protein [Verrucomicrobiota bacterium JB024]